MTTETLTPAIDTAAAAVKAGATVAEAVEAATAAATAAAVDQISETVAEIADTVAIIETDTAALLAAKDQEIMQCQSKIATMEAELQAATNQLREALAMIPTPDQVIAVATAATEATIAQVSDSLPSSADADAPGKSTHPETLPADSPPVVTAEPLPPVTVTDQPRADADVPERKAGRRYKLV